MAAYFHNSDFHHISSLVNINLAPSSLSPPPCPFLPSKHIKTVSSPMQIKSYLWCSKGYSRYDDQGMFYNIFTHYRTFKPKPYVTIGKVSWLPLLASLLRYHACANVRGCVCVYVCLKAKCTWQSDLLWSSFYCFFFL